MQGGALAPPFLDVFNYNLGKTAFGLCMDYALNQGIRLSGDGEIGKGCRSLMLDGETFGYQNF